MSDSFFKHQGQRIFSRGGLARASVLAGLLTFGLAHAAADVTTEYFTGELTGPQAFAGEGYRSIGLVNSSDQPVEFTLSRLHDGVTVSDFVKANDARSSRPSQGPETPKWSPQSSSTSSTSQTSPSTSRPRSRPERTCGR